MEINWNETMEYLRLIINYIKHTIMKTLQNILIIVISLNFTISSQAPLEKKVEKGAFVKYEIIILVTLIG